MLNHHKIINFAYITLCEINDFYFMVKKVTRKKKIEKVGYCYDCKHAYLMQSHKYNPIISECSLNKERQVAKSFLCTIGTFEENKHERVVHDMKPVTL